MKREKEVEEMDAQERTETNREIVSKDGSGRMDTQGRIETDRDSEER